MISAITKARKIRKIRLTHATLLSETLIKYVSNTRARKTRERRIINNISLLETSIKHTFNIKNAGCNLPISDESNIKFLINNPLHQLQRTLS